MMKNLYKCLLLYGAAFFILFCMYTSSLLGVCLVLGSLGYLLIREVKDKDDVIEANNLIESELNDRPIPPIPPRRKEIKYTVPMNLPCKHPNYYIVGCYDAYCIDCKQKFWIK